MAGKKILLFVTIGILLFFGLTRKALAATYFSSGTLTSSNLLSGIDVSTIDKFGYNASSIQVGTSIQVQFSQDSTNWYNSSNTPDGWDTLSQGDFTAEGDAINLSSLSWSSAYFYYKVQFNTTDSASTGVLDEVAVFYTPGASIYTNAASFIRSNVVTGNAEFTIMDGGNATTRGFQYGLTETPTWDVHEDGDFSAGTFSLEITGLNPLTMYYYRAYAINPQSTAYGEWTSFTTKSAYYTSGTITSANILSGQTVIEINSFDYTLSSKPAGTTVTVQFSQDNSNWYNSSGVLDGTDTLKYGDRSIGICILNWSEANFYYKIQFSSDAEGSSTPVLDNVSVAINDSENTCGSAGHWKFDDGYGSTVHNEGFGRSTLNGSLGTGNSAPSWNLDGKYGKALNFDGNDWVSFPDTSY